MAKTAKKSRIADYFATKLEAEWGPYDLKHALDERPSKILILDTRNAESFADEHIAGAVNIPEAEFEKRLKELPKNKEIVPYCWSTTCHIATRVSYTLAKKGYRVHELHGGIDRWKASEFEVTSSNKKNQRTSPDR